MSDPVLIQNPGSAIGEAIGAAMETSLGTFLNSIAEVNNFHYVSKSPIVGKKKLLMYDQFGTEYNIDSVIADQSMRPLILLESKYIRYKKHNRDKGSWLCTAHPAVRRRYHSIRSSIAVLAGNWSLSSLAMMKSFDINIFLIPYAKICEFLAVYDIDFDWGEKDRAKAVDAWLTYQSLQLVDKQKIGDQMISLIKTELEQLIISIIDESVEREVSKITVELHSNLGEVKFFEFDTVESAIEFLNKEELGQLFITTDSLTLFDGPPSVDEG